MTDKTKLLIGICLPLVVIILVIGSLIFPSMFFQPKYDFVYTVDPYCINYDYNCNSYGYSQWSAYKVVDGRVEKETILPKNLPVPAVVNKKPEALQVSYPKIYRYSVANDTFSVISLEDAQKLSLTDSGSSPDGVIVSNDYYSSGGIIGELLGGRRSREGLYMQRGSASKRIAIQNVDKGNYYYNQNFHLIGWVK